MKLRTWIYGQGVVQTDAKPEFDKTYDLIVAGLGSAGAIALITAARRGLKTLGIDKLPLMGGSATAGGISSYYYGIPGGISEEIDDRARTIAQENFVSAGKFHPEARHLALEEAAISAGAEPVYESRVTGVYLEKNRVCGIRLLSYGHSRDIECEMLIDATGDGEICAMAGCAFSYGREFDGIAQPYSHVPCWVADGRHGAINSDAASTAPAVDGAALSRANAVGSARQLLDAYTENKKLLFAGRLLGLREGRLITGGITLTLCNYLDGYASKQPVCYEFANLDTHTKDWAFESDTVQEWLTVASLWGQNFAVPIPIEAMIPKGFEGLMTAGRCISVDHDLAQAVRMQQAMQQCGEAVATAAAMAHAKGVPVRELPYEALADELRKTGCLPENSPPTVTEQLTGDINEIRDSLSSEKPGMAIWSARCLAKTIQPHLQEWVKETDSQLARNAALAIGLLGDNKAIPVLRQIIRDRDPFIPESSRNHNAPRLCSALYLAGRLGDTEIVDDAAALIKDSESSFDIFSYAFTALLRLGEAHTELRKKAAKALRETLEHKEFRQTLGRRRNNLNEPSESYFRIAAARELDRWGIPHKLMDYVDLPSLTDREASLYRICIPD